MTRSDERQQNIDFLKDLLGAGPFQCYLCGEEDIIGDDGLCDACREKIRYYPNPTCLQPLDDITIGLQYSPEISAAVLRFKNYEETENAAFFSQFISVPKEWNADILIPIPTHPFKAIMRGLNHGNELCAHVSQATGIPFSTKLLFKYRLTLEQKGLDAASRRLNIRDSFVADPLVKGLSIVLVDDVFTTGATAYECAKVLKQEGARKVYLAALTSPRR